MVLNKGMPMAKIHKATWLHKLPSTPQDVKALAQRVAEAGFDMLIPCVKQITGIADYQSKVARVRDEYKTWDPLMVLADESNKLGLSIHAWCCVFPEGKDSNLLSSHPELTAVAGKEQAKTEEFRLGCPNRPEVQDYEAAIYQELIDNYPIAGVHLDYIRFTSGLCYCDYCQADYRRATAGDLNKLGFFTWNNAAAQDMDKWIKWRCDIVTRFVRRIRQASAKGKKELSAAVFFYYPGGLQDIGQDWEEWVRLGLLDYVFPMNYSVSTQIAAKWTRNNVATLKGTKGCRLWEGILRPVGMTTPRFMEHVRAILDAGVEGFTIFEYPYIKDEDFAEMKSLR
jgi:uncharacterized lipoprotein YddW (UPF0748 family)